jgi:TATA-binding protein-associated factor Taf7
MKCTKMKCTKMKCTKMKCTKMKCTKMKCTKMKCTKMKRIRDPAWAAASEASGAAGARHISNGIVRIGVRG